MERNLEWLRERYEDQLDFRRSDVRDLDALRDALADASHVFHFAAQVAVTHSLTDPRFDFDVNVLGTFNVLETIRAMKHRPPLFFTSTNKVYGHLGHLPLRETATRYELTDPALANGLAETTQLDFHTPYGCSKGTADQYILDYARSFQLPAVVFRMSCIYGPRQFGTEDQGWVAHFVKRALAGEPITVYGNGKQVRDVLFVEDFVDALLTARERIDRFSGRAFNLGGGPANTLSLIELLDHLAQDFGRTPTVEFLPERAGDQRYYVSDIRRFVATSGFAPQTNVRQGLSALRHWLATPSDRRRERPSLAESAP